MQVSHSIFILVCVAFKLLGVIIFLRGFLAIKTAVPGHATHSGQQPEPTNNVTDGQASQPLSALYGRLVVVLIDALRVDFVIPYQHSGLPRMKQVSKMVEDGEVLSFIAKAHPPTVTLPRIKVIILNHCLFMK